MNDDLTITGKIIQVLEPVGGESKKTGKPWKKQEYVLETYSNYPRQICFQIFGEDRINAANIQLGEDVTVQIEINSREYNGRWFTNIDARNVMKGIVQPGMPAGYAQPAGYGAMPPQGGYQMPQQGGYQMPQQGGYQMPQQGGYQMPPQGPAPAAGEGAATEGAGDDLPF